jgi:GGDEF domain-containing protein
VIFSLQNLLRVDYEKILLLASAIFRGDYPLDETFQIVERIRKTIFITKFDPVERLTISIGIASRSHAESLIQLLKLADKALYLAKDSGRNRSESHRPQTGDENGSGINS